MNLLFVRSIFKHVLGPNPDLPAEPQAGVIPYAWVREDISYLLITSRGTGKWIFPKGAITPDVDPRDIALLEAREEAGVSGTVSAQPIGSYRDWKTRGGAKIAVEVVLYPMLVEHQFDNWEESRQRHRHWVAFPELGKLITNPEILALVTHLNTDLCQKRDHGRMA